jgi:hypothetical protein
VGRHRLRRGDGVAGPEPVVEEGPQGGVEGRLVLAGYDHAVLQHVVVEDVHQGLQEPVPGRARDGGVELEVERRVGAVVRGGVRAVAAGLERSQQGVQAGQVLRRGAYGGQAGRLDLHRPAQLPDLALVDPVHLHQEADGPG